jgi:DNA-binding NtrC family response regulator
MQGEIIIVGKSPLIREILSRAESFASVPRPLLVRGERGTGKELLAAFIHSRSNRKDKPLVTVNCAVYNDELLASELFGHEKGAFTGADTAHAGCLEQADGGSLFFDEVGNMSLQFQAKLLRVLENNTFRRVGGEKSRKVDVRFIFATNADLEGMIERGEFRADLFDRMTFETLTLPPLRQRREDIPLLIEHFTMLLMREIPNFEPKTFSPEAMRELKWYYWPGNLRQLKNVVERLQLSEGEDIIRTVDLPPEITSSAPVGQNFEDKVEAYKKHLIISAWRDAGRNQKRAAAVLGMTYDQFRHYYKKYGLKDLIE